jgi:serine/threonine protein kinase
MICVDCEAPTDADPCAVCGASARLDGRYALVRELGRGALGTTFEAEGPDGIVAIKRVGLHGVDGKRREQLDREARVLRELEHPGIPRYIELVVAGGGPARCGYLVQELVRGETLASEATHHRYSEDEVLAIVAELRQILDYLHGRSPPVVHRDVKPANVIRRTGGGLVLIDFGSVRDVLKGEVGGSTVAGTFGFMAPEQFHGDATSATDLYGLGALSVALLTRKEPHTMLDRSQRLRWESHTRVSGTTESLIRGLLAPDPDARLQAMRGPRTAVAVRQPVPDVGNRSLQRRDPGPLFAMGATAMVVTPALALALAIAMLATLAIVVGGGLALVSAPVPMSPPPPVVFAPRPPMVPPPPPMAPPTVPSVPSRPPPPPVPPVPPR